MQVGARVRLQIGGADTEWTVIGVTESGTSPAAYAPREAIATLATGGRATSVVVASTYEGDASRLDLIQRLRSTLGDAGMPVASSQVLSEARRVLEDHFLMVVDFLAAVGWLMLLVGGMGLASTMSLAVLERTREIGVMRAIGAGHGAIFTLVQVEGLTIALLSWAAAIVLSVPISAVLAEAFGRIMLPVPVTFVPEIGGVARWFALVVGVSLVACAWPAIRGMRIATTEALAYE